MIETQYTEEEIDILVEGFILKLDDEERAIAGSRGCTRSKRARQIKKPSAGSTDGVQMDS